MKKELLEQLKNLTTDRIGDFLEEEVKEVCINSFLNPSFQGWVHRIILEDDGNLFISGSMSNNTSFISTYEGNSLELANIPAWRELDTELQDFDIENLTEEEQKELLESYLFDKEDTEIHFDYLEKPDNYNISNYSPSSLEPYFIELFPDKWKEILEDDVEVYWCNYGYDNLMDDINNHVEELLEYERYYEEEV